MTNTGIPSNSWLADDQAVNNEGDPWVRLSDIVARFRAGEEVMVDLEGDAYADPEGDRPELEFEYATLDDVEVDGDQVTLYFDIFGSVTFPLDHALPVAKG